MIICNSIIYPNQYQSILLIVHDFKPFNVPCRNYPTFSYYFLLRNVITPNRISPQFAQSVYIIGSFFPVISNDRVKAISTKIKERGGMIKSLLEEDFVTLYESILLVTDAITRKQSYSGSAALENIQQTYHSNIHTAEIENAGLSNSYYITKGFYIGKIQCTSFTPGNGMCLDYQTIFQYSVPTPIFSNGYDLTVCNIIYIIN